MLVIGRQYKKSEVFPFYVRLKGGTTREALDEFIAQPAAHQRRLKVLGGHVNFGLHRYFDNYTYLTLFRDPVKRIVSLYSMALSDPRYYLHNIVITNRMKLKDFVSSGLSPELNNGQTRMIAGAENVKFGECTDAMLTLAKKNFDTFYPVFGITERYDESVLLLKHIITGRRLTTGRKTSQRTTCRNKRLTRTRCASSMSIMRWTWNFIAMPTRNFRRCWIDSLPLFKRS